MPENAFRTIKAGKILISVLTICVFISMCCGCTKDANCTYLYKTMTGETVEVGVDASSTGYKLKTTADEFFVIHDGVLVKGLIRSAESINNYRLSIKNDAGSKMLKDNGKELWWTSYNHDKDAVEYEALLRISDKTYVIMGGVISDKASEEDIESIIKKVSVRVVP